ncbi:alpha/beta fold hydrolase [Lolliginicoccus levis]|uniref:alpha/beta fold hydrolase n=1 Tax=Lolliginicoccus levis TaxID=2919542 RepID=UPI00241E3A73|nr:alpha/beta hydrolase [Lolliginicoccus levis]
MKLPVVSSLVGSLGAFRSSAHQIAERTTGIAMDAAAMQAAADQGDHIVPMIPSTSRMITAHDGTRLHVQITGRPGSQPIVLSHGWTCSSTYWMPQIEALAREFRVITYDQRGHGKSEMGRFPLSPDVLADDFSSVLDSVLAPAERAVVVGHSMGGMTLMAWAGKRPHEVPERASAAMLLSTASDRLTHDEAVLPPLLRPLPMRPLLLGAAIAAPLPTRFLPSSALHYATMGTAATAEQREFCLRMVRECAPRVRGRWGVVLGKLDIAAALDNLAVPTTVVVGTADRLTPPVHSYRLRDKLDSSGNLAGFIELPDVGHMSSVEAPEPINAEIRRLAGVPQRLWNVG